MQARIKRIDRGDLETEKVVIEALEDCNMGRFLLFDTTYDESGIESNKNRHMYLFSDLHVQKDDFVVLYTRQSRANDLQLFQNKRGTTTYNLYWNLDTTVWNNTGDTAYLVHYDAWESKESK